MSNEINVEEKILKCISVLKRKTKVQKSGGNCGQYTYSIYRYILDKYKESINIGILTDYEVEESDTELLGDVDIMHVYLKYGDKKFDETGIINDDYLDELSHREYDASNCLTYEFDMTNEVDKKLILKIISVNTNYTVDWNYFYDILEKNDI